MQVRGGAFVDLECGVEIVFGRNQHHIPVGENLYLQPALSVGPHHATFAAAVREGVAGVPVQATHRPLPREHGGTPLLSRGEGGGLIRKQALGQGFGYEFAWRWCGG